MPARARAPPRSRARRASSCSGPHVPTRGWTAAARARGHGTKAIIAFDGPRLTMGIARALARARGQFRAGECRCVAALAFHAASALSAAVVTRPSRSVRADRSACVLPPVIRPESHRRAVGQPALSHRPRRSRGHAVSLRAAIAGWRPSAAGAGSARAGARRRSEFTRARCASGCAPDAGCYSDADTFEAASRRLAAREGAGPVPRVSVQGVQECEAPRI